MLYSHNQESEKLNLFTLFLDHAVKGDSKYTPVVNDVIFETHQYVAGAKNIYNINRNLVNLILLLSDLNKKYFQTLSDKPEHYNKETYTKVQEIISQVQLSAAY